MNRAPDNAIAESSPPKYPIAEQHNSRRHIRDNERYTRSPALAEPPSAISRCKGGGLEKGGCGRTSSRFEQVDIGRGVHDENSLRDALLRSQLAHSKVHPQLCTENPRKSIRI